MAVGGGDAGVAGDVGVVGVAAGVVAVGVGHGMRDAVPVVALGVSVHGAGNAS